MWNCQQWNYGGISREVKKELRRVDIKEKIEYTTFAQKLLNNKQVDFEEVEFIEFNLCIFLTICIQNKSFWFN